MGEIAKELGDRWNHTAPEGKHSFEESAQKDKERYEKVRLKSIDLISISFNYS